MEEDIKVLEDYAYAMCTISCTTEKDKRIAQAIENLIKGYKEQKEKIDILENEILYKTIPTEKVIEKIEILEKHKQNIKPNTLDTAYKQAYCDGGIDSLNEIL